MRSGLFLHWRGADKPALRKAVNGVESLSSAQQFLQAKTRFS